MVREGHDSIHQTEIWRLPDAELIVEKRPAKRDIPDKEAPNGPDAMCLVQAPSQIRPEPQIHSWSAMALARQMVSRLESLSPLPAPG